MKEIKLSFDMCCMSRWMVRLSMIETVGNGWNAGWGQVFRLESMSLRTESGLWIKKPMPQWKVLKLLDKSFTSNVSNKA